MEEKDVFISYSSKDQVDADEICLLLERNGISCFIAQRDIPKGVEWANVIPTAIEHCKCLLCIYSNHFNDSKHVVREMTIADKKNKPLISYRIDDSEYQKTTEYYLSPINWIYKDENEAFDKLLNTIRDKLNLPIQYQKQKEYDTLLKYLGIFVGFILLFIIGFYHAYRKSTTVEQLSITALQHIRESNNKENLVYIFSDECFVYNRNEKTISKFPSADFITSTLSNNKLILEAKLGYVGIGVILSKMFHVKVKGRQAVYYYVFVGAAIVCGYGVGYYVHEQFYPAQYSDKMKSFLSEKAHWEQIDKRFKKNNWFDNN